MGWRGVRKEREGENENRSEITSRQKKLSHLLENSRGWKRKSGLGVRLKRIDGGRRWRRVEGAIG